MPETKKNRFEKRQEKRAAAYKIRLVTELHPNQQTLITKAIKEVQILDYNLYLAALSRAIVHRYKHMWQLSGEYTTEQVTKAVSRAVVHPQCPATVTKIMEDAKVWLDDKNP